MGATCLGSVGAARAHPARSVARACAPPRSGDGPLAPGDGNRWRGQTGPGAQPPPPPRAPCQPPRSLRAVTREAGRVPGGASLGTAPPRRTHPEGRSGRRAPSARTPGNNKCSCGHVGTGTLPR